MFLVQLFNLLGGANEAVVAISNKESNGNRACQDGNDETKKKTPVGSHGDLCVVKTV
jgi:hypothetical protein